MPRYFFHRMDGVRDLDHEGIEFPSLDEARAEAVHFASDTLKDIKYALWRGGEFCIEVTDSSRALLFKVSISAVNASSESLGGEQGDALA